MKPSWRATTQQWHAPNLDSPRLFRSPTRRSAPRPRSASPSSRIPTTTTPDNSDTRQKFRRSWLPSTNTSFQSQTPNRRKLSPTCLQKALKGTETPVHQRDAEVLSQEHQTHSQQTLSWCISELITFKHAANVDFITQYMFVHSGRCYLDILITPE